LNISKLSRAKKSASSNFAHRIDWQGFRGLLEELNGYDKRDWSKGDQPPFDPVFMFKVLVVQKYRGLSDDATEAQIADRLSFQSFPGLHKKGERPEGFGENTAKGRQKDIEARWAKKNNQVHYGWKNHAKVDLQSGLKEQAHTQIHNDACQRPRQSGVQATARQTR